MSDMKNAANVNLDPAQAAELATLVELEARWENLRTGSSRPAGAQPTLQDLHGKQKAYEVFRGKLAAYNKRYKPAHASEQLLNTPVRLGLWCQAMRDLFARVEHNTQVRCPIQLVEKAYRWADRVASRTGKTPLCRPTPPATVQAALGELDTVGRWCTDVSGVTSAA